MSMQTLIRRRRRVGVGGAGSPGLGGGFRRIFFRNTELGILLFTVRDGHLGLIVWKDIGLCDIGVFSLGQVGEDDNAPLSRLEMSLQ